jgi:sugar phosphate isomerase/epimerase
LQPVKPHIHVPFEKIGEHIEFIKRFKLNLEIYFTSDILDNINRDNIKDLLKNLDYNPSLSIHSPFMDLSPGAIDSKVRVATIERFMEVLEIAEILRPKCIVFHSGYEKWKYALKIEPWLKQSLLTWKEINGKAEEIGVKIAIENIFEDNPKNLRLLVESMNSENFGICFDSGHFNLFSAVSLEEWLDEIKEYIIELHLHDNDKSSDQHLPIGEGSFDFDLLFDKLKSNNCIYTIEARSPEMVLKSIWQLQKGLQ